MKENRGYKVKILSQEQERWLIDYLERPEMSYTNPGRKDNIYIGKTNGTKQQTRTTEILSLGIKGRFRHPKQPRTWFPRQFRRKRIFRHILPFYQMQETIRIPERYPRYFLPLWSLKKCCNDGKSNSETKICSSNKCPQHCLKILVWFRWSEMHEKHLWNLSAKIIQSWDADSLSSVSEIDPSESSHDDESDYISVTMGTHQDKKIKNVTKCSMQKEYYNNWEQMVIELKEHIHRKRMQVATYNSCKADLKQN